MDSLHKKAYLPLPSTDEGALDPNSSYARILQFVDGPKRVVDFGCGPGNLARFLTQRGCAVTGVDVNEQSAGLAREYCEEVLVADLDSASLLKLFPSERFDIAIFADVIEHLRAPSRLLRETHQILRSGGFVLASIPNVSHGAVRLSLLQGEFKYEPLGVLDDSHLRFFTRKSMEELFDSCDFAIDEVDRTTCPLFGGSNLVPVLDPADFSDELVAQIEREYDSTTLQFIVKAVPVQALQHRRRVFSSHLLKGEATPDTGSAGTALAISELEQTIARKDVELAVKQAEIEKASRHIEDLTGRLHIHEDRANRHEAEDAQLRELLRQATERALHLESTNAQHQVIITELETRISENVRKSGEERGQWDALKQRYLRHRERGTAMRKRITELCAELDAAVALRDDAVAQAQAQASEIRQLRAEYNHLDAEHAGLLEEKSLLESRLDALEKTFFTLEKHADSLRAALAHSEQRREHHEARNFELNEMLAHMEASYRKQLQTAAKRIEEVTTRYDESAATGAAAEHLSALDAEELRRTKTLVHVAKAQQRSLSAHLASTRSEVERLETALHDSTAEIHALRAEVEVRHAEIQRGQEYVQRVESAYHSALAQAKALENSVAHADARARDMSVELADARKAAHELQSKLDEREWLLQHMRASKFWRVRNAWFGVKRLFGIETDIS